MARSPITRLLIPCFEVWILLHFERTDASFGSCHEVIQRVCSHLPRYEKTDKEISKHLIDHLDTALANAHWLTERGESNRYNPYTTVQTLLLHLQSVSSQ
ncbi:RloB domain-containing protein [Ferrovum myxofaciens]|uniref:RloB domain-containing protein n=1 Tax=Ferrovum myxofaciens TaxID=416213 RepID=UPI0004E24229|nr:RloB domain-containing protein [Ferrovum myxofaciens]